MDEKTKRELISMMNTYAIVSGIGEELQTLTYADFIALLLTEVDIYVGLTKFKPEDVEEKDKKVGAEVFVDALNEYVLKRHLLRKNLAKEKLEGGRK